LLKRLRPNPALLQKRRRRLHLHHQPLPKKRQSNLPQLNKQLLLRKPKLHQYRKRLHPLRKLNQLIKKSQPKRKRRKRPPRLRRKRKRKRKKPR